MQRGVQRAGSETLRLPSDLIREAMDVGRPTVRSDLFARSVRLSLAPSGLIGNQVGSQCGSLSLLSRWG
jgi:hypothetical protein